MSDQPSAWDLFWHYDRIASFGSGPGAANYGEAIAGGWREFFSALTDGARVLDLCTGNGAIAVMAVEAGKSLDVTGADLADIQPASFVSSSAAALGQIHFLASTPAEQLPLAGASFDAVVSQYGIEYSQLARSLAEAVRVLVPGGRLRLAIHAAEGSVAADTRRAIADADFLLDEIDLAGRAARCFEAVVAAERATQRTAGQAARAQEAYAAFKEGLSAVSARMASATDQVMLRDVRETLTDAFQKRQFADVAELVAKADDLRQEIAAHRERQRALLSSAQSADQMAQLADQLGQLGMIDASLGEQRDGGDLIGWTIEATRPA